MISANPNCQICFGIGSYYHVTPMMASGVTMICECVPGELQRRRRAEILEILFSITLSLIVLVITGWTAVLWWRWLNACI